METIVFFGVMYQFILAYLSISLIIGKRNQTLFRIVIVFSLSIVCAMLHFLVGVYASLFLLFGNYVLAYLDLKRSVFALGVLGMGMIFNLLFDHVATMIDTMLDLQDTFSPAIFFSIHLGVVSLLCVSFSILTRKLLIRYLPQGLDSKEGNVMSLLCFFTYLVYLVCIFLGVGLGNTIQFIQLNLLFFTLCIVFMLVSFSFYSRSLKKEYQVKQKELEYQALHRYTAEIEAQYAQMLKFRHDYQNILSSLSSYIEKQDLLGLSDYYHSILQHSSKNISENNFKLNDLNKIKVTAAKSLLASKLIYAKEKGIDASFEANDQVDEMYIDTLVLIRVLGVFLDNAIEELEVLGYGDLKTAVIKYSNSIEIIIENTCHKEVGHYRQLRQAGYSTKGHKRGLGLSNVDELLKFEENVALETIIENERFTQILYISKV